MERIKNLSRKSTFPLFPYDATHYFYSSVVPMDWRAMSRSRSRISMDWRPTSRSRSRPPESTSFDRHGLTNNQYGVGIPFPAMDSHSSQDNSNNARGMSMSIPMAESSFHSNTRRSLKHGGVHPRTDLSVLYEGPSDSMSALYENSSESRFPPGPVYHHPPSTYNYGTFESSLPTSGLHGHHLSGKLHLSDNFTGTKRRAETVIFDSLLRTDPSNMDGTHSPIDREIARNENTSPFPSTSFNFSFPPYEGILDIPTTASAAPLAEPTRYPSNLRPNLENSRYHPTRSSSTSDMYQSSRSPPLAGRGLSAAEEAPSAMVAEEYARLANMEGSVLGYRQLMGFAHSNLDGSPMGQNPYTHVDPTQILSVGQGVFGRYAVFHASPSNDGLVNGVGSSSNASPESYNTSSASTPPLTEGSSNGQHSRPLQWKYISLHQGAQDVQRKKSMPSPTLGEQKSSPSTPELGGTELQSGKPEEADHTQTLCTNCQTTNTPIWRRDPEGQPLCEIMRTYLH